MTYREGATEKERDKHTQKDGQMEIQKDRDRYNPD